MLLHIALISLIASIMHCAHLCSLSLLQVSAAHMLMVRGQMWFGCSAAAPRVLLLLLLVVQVQTGMS